MTKSHTPGPWHIGFSNGATMVRAENKKPIVECWLHEDTGPNARLIAAAPDLLAALTKIVSESYKMGMIEQEAIDQARAAIARATGN